MKALALAGALALAPCAAHAWPASEAGCATFARQDTKAEVHPANTTANRTDVADGVSWSEAPTWGAKITGNFTGTTHQIIRWSACKWLGQSSLEVKRWAAQLSVESSHIQSSVGCDGDCYGLAQIRASTWPGAYPRIAQSTAWNTDAGAMYMRSCRAGKFDDWDNMGGYLATSGTARWEYCLGVYYAGEQPTEANGGQDYIRTVKARLASWSWSW